MHHHIPLLRSRHQHLIHQRLFSLAFQLSALQHGVFFFLSSPARYPKTAAAATASVSPFFPFLPFFTPDRAQMRQREKKHKQQEGRYSLRMREKPINSWREFRRPAFVLTQKRIARFPLFQLLSTFIQIKQFLAVSEKRAEMRNGIQMSYQKQYLAS